MLNKRFKNQLYDLTQKLWVTTCIAVTIGSSVYLGYRAWQYIVYIKPVKKEMEERFKEELLKEGRMLRDTTTTLK